MLTNLRTSFFLAAGFLLASTQWTFAADFGLKTSETQPPEGVADEIAATLEPKVYEISKGEKTLYRFWFGKANLGGFVKTVAGHDANRRSDQEQVHHRS